MAPVINRNNYSNQRSSYLRFIATALDELEKENAKISENSQKDIWIFIYLTLLEIQKSVQTTIQPWEKRGYWVKADQFRAEWNWLEPVRNSIERKIKTQDWKDLENDKKTLKAICKDYPAYQKMSIKNPWNGAWEKWKKIKSV